MFIFKHPKFCYEQVWKQKPFNEAGKKIRKKATKEYESRNKEISKESRQQKISTMSLRSR